MKSIVVEDPDIGVDVLVEKYKIESIYLEKIRTWRCCMDCEGLYIEEYAPTFAEAVRCTVASWHEAKS